ncbi:MAG: ABC transporter permease [Firmicutes bacterium]|nr:ABC transporter permease [Bacillota bacterium]
MAKNNTNVNGEAVVKKQNQWVEAWKRLTKNWSAMAGLAILVIIILAAIFADVLYDYDNVVIKQNISARLQAPSAEHWFGTDEVGRDVFARIVHGARISLAIGLSANVVSLTIGGILGACAGFYGGKLDMIIMRIMDVFLAIPGTLLAICIMAALGSSVTNVVIAMAVSGCPGYARIVRSAVMPVRDMEYVEAARAIGCTNKRIIFAHVIPNSLAPIIVQATMHVASVILTIAGLSFLGLGISPPTPEWGSMLSAGRAYIRGNSYLTMFPGLAIMITILALNLLGDGLRDALDPRLR